MQAWVLSESTESQRGFAELLSEQSKAEQAAAGGRLCFGRAVILLEMRRVSKAF
jgi:hypothetical protein